MIVESEAKMWEFRINSVLGWEGSVQRVLMWPVLLLATTTLGVGAQGTDPCAPSPAVQAAIDNLPVRSLAETDWEFRQKLLSAHQALLSRYPDDMFVQRAYISVARQFDWDKLSREYKALHEQKPDDPRIAFLYGLLLEGRRSAEAIQVLEGALAKRPDYPWPHRPLARIYRARNFLKKDLADAHDRAFLEACPAELGSYGPLLSMDDKALLASAATRLRAVIEKRTDAAAIGAYQALWSLEFKIRSPGEYPAVRKQIGQDLERIRSLKLENRQPWYNTLEKGYTLVNERQQADWAEAERERLFPQPWPAALWKWMEAHSRPAPDNPPGKKREYYADLLKETEAWLKARPNYAYLWSLRFDAIAHLDDAPAADFLAAADQAIKVLEKDAGPPGPPYYQYFSVAEALSKKHLQPERVLEIAKKGLARWERAEPLSDLYSPKEERDFYQSLGWLDGTALEIGSYLDLKRAEEAGTRLARMEERLGSLKKLAGDDPDNKREYSQWMTNWWGLMARQAQLQSHPLDAMAYYENALLTRIEGRQKPESGVADELAENARRLWTKLGGTSEGWQTWYGRPAAALARQGAITWNQVNEPLPAFELTDVKGKTWNLTSLKGKVTFLNFWASW